MYVSGVGIAGVLTQSVRRSVRHVTARHVGGTCLNHGSSIEGRDREREEGGRRKEAEGDIVIEGTMERSVKIKV